MWRWEMQSPADCCNPKNLSLLCLPSLYKLISVSTFEYKSVFDFVNSIIHIYIRCEVSILDGSEACLVVKISTAHSKCSLHSFLMLASCSKNMRKSYTQRDISFHKFKPMVSHAFALLHISLVSASSKQCHE